MATQLLKAIRNRRFPTILEEVYKRAATDPEFRELALNDAEAAFDEVGGDLGDWDLQFVEPEEDGADDVLQLPESIETAPELSEDELEAVAGGAQLIADCSKTENTCDDTDDIFAA